MTLTITKNYSRYYSEDILEIGWAILHGAECCDYQFSVHRSSGNAMEQFARLEMGKSKTSYGNHLFVLDPASIKDPLMALVATPGQSMPAEYVRELARAFCRDVAQPRRVGKEFDALFEKRAKGLVLRIREKPEDDLNRRTPEEILAGRKEEFDRHMDSLKAAAREMIRHYYGVRDASELILHHRKSEELRRYLMKRGVVPSPVPEPELALKHAADETLGEALLVLSEKRKEGP